MTLPEFPAETERREYEAKLAAKDAEIARLKSFNENQSAVNRDLLTELVSSKAEIARLRRDNDRLNTFAMQFCEWDDASHPDTHLRIKDEYNPALYQKQKDEIARLTHLEKGIAKLLIYKDGYIPITTDDALTFIKNIFDKETLARIENAKLTRILIKYNISTKEVI